MSDTFMVFMPTDRTFVPLPAAQTRAAELLRKYLPKADEIEFEASEDPEFVSGLGNWSGVNCPFCGADLDPNFGDLMNAAYEPSHFRDLRMTTPCCGIETSLDQLKYGWPTGFTRFILKARNPQLNDVVLKPDQHQELEQTLGCSLRIIWEHL